MSNLNYSEGSSSSESEDFYLPDRIYYSGNAYALEHKGTYIPLKSASDVSAHLKSAGFEQADTVGILCAIRTRNYVTYIGPVAGHPPGVNISPDSGKKFLVTDGPLLIQGKPGAFPFIAAYLRELFGPDPMQIEAATAWVRQARENVVLKKRRPLARHRFGSARATRCVVARKLHRRLRRRIRNQPRVAQGLKATRKLVPDRGRSG